MKKVKKMLIEDSNAFSNIERDVLRMKYPELFPKLEAIFYAYDPIGINFGSNPDEYALEVESVLKRLPYAHSQEDVHTMVYEAFCQCFDVQLAGDKESTIYKNIAKESWEAWCRDWGEYDEISSDEKSE